MRPHAFAYHQVRCQLCIPEEQGEGRGQRAGPRRLHPSAETSPGAMPGGLLSLSLTGTVSGGLPVPQQGQDVSFRLAALLPWTKPFC